LETRAHAVLKTGFLGAGFKKGGNDRGPHNIEIESTDFIETFLSKIRRR
jgi:hypothetical protein